jgi:hypothetical protein
MIAAQGRIDNGPPVAVIDIGSNSVRLVVYEGLTRSLTPIFNEKVLAGLGREVLTTGLLHSPYGSTEALPVSTTTAKEVLAEESVARRGDDALARVRLD